MKTSFFMTSIALTVLLLTGCAGKSERQFISGCRSGGGDTATCSCIYSKLEKKFGADALEHEIRTIQQTEAFHREMINSTYQCLKE
ncbi:hypothetical protein CDG60_14550 [Acinetobacter chinensis]|uniref:Lipoprotein n=1 Tax=Acinetobacter chinensis TaxID=2004650 RepID=A0A3B7M042_9GAMM|nr:hypothetical protein [Acinetobacter chinensis]AXY57675.1 hypothetical protein CDG60_14550 [Acinetobacter chinensis]